MSNTPTLIAVQFDEPLLAQELLLAFARLVKHGSLDMEDAAIVLKEDDGKIRLRQTRDVMPGQGAASGGWVGALLGIIGGPLGMLAGGALGAAAGGLFAKLRDVGIDDDQMKEMGEQLDRGSAALFVLLNEYDVTAVAMELRRFEGELFYSTADEAITQRFADELAVTI
jgi:uncharacterized membrane protein